MHIYCFRTLNTTPDPDVWKSVPRSEISATKNEKVAVDFSLKKIVYLFNQFLVLRGNTQIRTDFDQCLDVDGNPRRRTCFPFISIFIE